MAPVGAPLPVPQPTPTHPPKIEVAGLNFYYGAHQVLEDINLKIQPNQVTALIGPSGCGKSTFLRSLNRMNDIVPGTRVEGSICIDTEDIYASSVDVVDLRRRVGMVFQKSNPFPKSIFDNVAYGLRINRMTSSREELRGPRRGEPEGRGALGRSPRSAAHLGAGALGRPAAAALHRARAGGRARDPADGRAGVGPRPDRDRRRSRS